MRVDRISFASFRMMAVTLLTAALCGGCNLLQHGFLDPGEVGRYQREPLTVPILSTLGVDVEEPLAEFAQATEVQPQDLLAVPTDYVIGRNDLVSVSIADLVAQGIETVKTARVSESGNISLPLVGQVRAEGLTEAQLEQAIIEAYRTANLLTDATVTVTVIEARARTFSILGSVARPGQYQILQSDFRVLDALVMSGDITAQGVDNIYIVRRLDIAERAPEPVDVDPAMPPPPAEDPLAPRGAARPSRIGQEIIWMDAAQPGPVANQPAGEADEEGRYIIVDGQRRLVGAPRPEAPDEAPEDAPMIEDDTFEFESPMSPQNIRIIRVPVYELKEGALRYNVVIRPQDLIMVPLPVFGEYYMDGHVARTGVYSLTARRITLKQAVAAAGGFDAIAIPKKTEIIRRIGRDREVFTAVDLDKVFAGQQPDIYLKPNDVVRVGTTAYAPFLAAIRNGFRVTYGFGFLYDRNYAPVRRQQ